MMGRVRGNYSTSLPLQWPKSKSTIFRLSPILIKLITVIILLMQIAASQVLSSSSILIRKTSTASDWQYQIVQGNWNQADIVMRQNLSSELTWKKKNVSSGSGSFNERDVSAKIKTSKVPLKDSHNKLGVFWAGDGVVLCWTKYEKNVNSSSTLWISRDDGNTWTNNTQLLVQNPPAATSIPPALEGFFYHPSNNGHFLFTDTKNGYIFTTQNYGVEFQTWKVDFIPDEIFFDPHSVSNLVAHETHGLQRMWVSTNFGESWTLVAENVKSLSWDDSVKPAALYLQREDRNSKNVSVSESECRSLVLKSNSLFLYANKTELVISGVEGFGMMNGFMFATRRKDNDSYELLISYRRSDFITAQFPTSQQTKHFYIAEVLENGQIFVVVVHNESLSNLYVGSFPLYSSPAEWENPRFSMSLERILYFEPNVTWADREIHSEPFVALNRVEGVRGVYVATQLKPSTVSSGSLNINDMISMITYDQGGKWQILNSSEYEHNVPFSVHTYQPSTQLNPTTQQIPILTVNPVSEKSAPGLILATGGTNKRNATATLKENLEVGVYLSTDGAVSWRQVLQGNYFYELGDHGGIIVATKMYRISGDETNEILYSIDDGDTWEKYEFYEKNIRVSGLMTEPGKNSTTFFIFGSVALEPKSRSNSIPVTSSKTLVIFKLDFRDIFERNCSFPEDYRDWSPYARDGRQCLMGRKETYSRRIPGRKCYNGNDFRRKVATKRCACTRADFECDFGYVLDNKDGKCVRNSSVDLKHESCHPSAKFYKKTKGYRRIQGNICQQGDWVSEFLPEVIPCEMSELDQFLLVAKRDFILRIDLNHLDGVETLPLTRSKRDITAFDFDMRKKNQTVFWSDASTKTINKLRLDGKSQAEVLVSTDLGSVWGLALDWEANALYFTNGDRKNPAIEVVHVGDLPENGRRLRKRLLGKAVLDKPRSIALNLYTQMMFWTDWSAHNPGIGRSDLMGIHVERVITRDSAYVRRLHGISIDHYARQIYWADAELGIVLRSDYYGSEVSILLERDPRVNLRVSVSYYYKNTIYWNDWNTRSIYRVKSHNPASLHHSHEPCYFVNNSVQILGNLSTVVDLKVFGMGMRKYTADWNRSLRQKDCRPQEHLCLKNQFQSGASRLCADGFFLQNGTCVCPDGLKPNATSGNCVSNCAKDTFKCRSHPDYCIPSPSRCNGKDECGDWSDEEDCEDVSGEDNCNSLQCPQTEQNSSDERVSDKSGSSSWDGSCSELDDMFECLESKECISIFWRCDGLRDCQDGSDELGCNLVITAPSKTMTPSEKQCDEFKCDDGTCLVWESVCDRATDCPGTAEEERECWTFAAGRCPMNMTRCGDTCIPKENSWDGENKCPDVEAKNEPIHFFKVNCNAGGFACDDNICMPLMKLCDKQMDCIDGTDEAEDICKKQTKRPEVYQVERIAVVDTDSRTVTLEWRLPRLPEAIKKELVFILAFCNPEVDRCWNATLGNVSSTQRMTIGGFTPFTNYNLTLILKHNDAIYPPFVYVTATTLEASSSLRPVENTFWLNRVNRGGQDTKVFPNLTFIIILLLGLGVVLIGFVIRYRHLKTAILNFQIMHWSRSSSERVVLQEELNQDLSQI